MPPRKKSKPAKYEDDDFLDDDDPEVDDEDFVEDDDEDDEPVKKRKPAKKKAAPKKETPAKKPKKEDDRIMTPHVALEGPQWDLVPPSLLYREAPPTSSEKIAAFDFDGTLVQFKDPTATFSMNANDWKLFNPEVPKVLEEYYDKGYKIVVFSNQSNIGQKLDGPASIRLRQRAENAFAKIGVPATIMYATGKDNEKKGYIDAYRKPKTGMWDFLVANLNGGVAPDKAQCFYVGDMAGRPSDPGAQNNSDRLLAEAIGIDFKTPEEVFGPRDDSGAAAAQFGGPNADLAAVISQLADACQNKGDNPFKIRAFRKAAGIIAEHPQEVTCGADMKGVAGVGKGTMALIDEFKKTGTLAELEAAGGFRKPGDAPAAPTGDASMALKFL